MISSSQKLKSRYQIGDVIAVKVIEKIDAKSWIVSLEGTLIQVKNPASLPLVEGEMIRMQVVSIHPPQLSLDIR